MGKDGGNATGIGASERALVGLNLDRSACGRLPATCGEGRHTCPRRPSRHVRALSRNVPEWIFSWESVPLKEKGPFSDALLSNLC